MFRTARDSFDREIHIESLD